MGVFWQIWCKFGRFFEFMSLFDPFFHLFTPEIFFRPLSVSEEAVRVLLVRIARPQVPKLQGVADKGLQVLHVRFNQPSTSRLPVQTTGQLHSLSSRQSHVRGVQQQVAPRRKLRADHRWSTGKGAILLENFNSTDKIILDIRITSKIFPRPV